ncbi:MAG: ASCH domain-containing protein [Verrucomicrobiota bacterium]
MRVRTFKPQFAPLVLNGSKRQTIRPMPKRLPKVGDLESWRQWTGRPYNSTQRELAKVRITAVEKITITEMGICVGEGLGEVLNMVQEWEMVKADGFNTPKDFVEWFNFHHGLPFTGILIKADDL